MVVDASGKTRQSGFAARHDLVLWARDPRDRAGSVLLRSGGEAPGCARTARPTRGRGRTMRQAAAPLAIVAVLLAGFTGAMADSGGFDMSTEQSSQTRTAAPPADSPPFVAPLATAPAQSSSPPLESVGAAGVVPAAQRAILPAAVLRLN